MHFAHAHKKAGKKEKEKEAEAGEEEERGARRTSAKSVQAYFISAVYFFRRA